MVAFRGIETGSGYVVRLGEVVLGGGRSGHTTEWDKLSLS